jgi:hypothetical protein
VTLFRIILEADQCTGLGGGCVSELNDSVRDPAPFRRAVLLLGGSEFVGACRTFLKRSTAIALEPRLCRPRIVDLGYHAAEVYDRRR